jgi:tRNA(Ile)-lysidine synthase TilS/MesJ
MAYSGGKDSTYTLDVFVNRYKLKVLAFTFDNTFIPDNALQNIRTVCSCLGVDHITIRPDPDMLRAVFRTASKEELYSQKTIERASTICTSCIGFVKSIVLRTAIEKGVPFVGFGWSPGQAPVEASVMKTNASLISTTQKSIYGPLYTIVGDRINPYFLFEEHFTQEDKFPWNIHPLAFLDYNEEKIIERNNQLGWIKPGNTDANSTNCLLNAFANQVHKERYGFHPYVWELANMVRAGVMDRTCALHKIETPENPEIVSYARDILE